MAKKREFQRLGIMAHHAPDTFGVDTSKPGWRQTAKDDGIDIDENDLIYRFERYGDKRDTSIVRIGVRCGTPTEIVVKTLRKIASFIERDCDMTLLANSELEVWLEGIEIDESGELVVPSFEVEDESAEQPAIA